MLIVFNTVQRDSTNPTVRVKDNVKDKVKEKEKEI
tara:strand:- start:3973 stop:4077 length:105 start_codon:yes stop_codon:yes gene_type:complete